MIPRRVPLLQLGRFGKMWLKNLNEANPEKYTRLFSQGKLLSIAREKDAQAENVFESNRSALLQKDPGPEDALGQAQHQQAIESQARELALKEILEPDPEYESASQKGGYM